jgi:hypothetical protein
MEMTPPPTADQRVRILRVFVVTRPDSGGKFCVYRSWAEVETEFDGAELGSIIHVSLQEMTQKELDNLPNFEGW